MGEIFAVCQVIFGSDAMSTIVLVDDKYLPGQGSESIELFVIPSKGKQFHGPSDDVSLIKI